jgi:uncharacterized membrane protein YcaP (DUF421 family)
MLAEFGLQAVKGLAYYGALIALMRMAGKRLAGQTTTFDLIVLITLGVVLQSTALQPGMGNALVFVATVFCAHRLMAMLCARHAGLRHLVRGKPRVIIRNGTVIDRALEEEDMGNAELLAGLRKLGIDSPDKVKLATLEETGHISAVPLEAADDRHRQPDVTTAPR